MYKMRFFDFEVFPHWWLCVFGDLPDDFETNPITINIKDSFKYVTSDDIDARDKLLAFFKEEGYCNCGYNIKNYDLAIANAIYQGFTPEQVKIVNDLIINPGCAWSTKEHIRLQPFAKRKLKSIVYQDLMDDSTGSLKEKEMTLGLNVLESSVEFNKEDLTQADKEDIIYYCKQDVYASMQWYIKVVLPYTKVKLAMGIHFNIPEDVCHKSTNAKLVALALNGKRRTFSDEEKIEIEIPTKIREYCYENLPIDVLEKIKKTNTGFTKYMFNNIASFGNGGIHSTYSPDGMTSPPLYIDTDDDYMMANIDATSYYPSIMIQFNLISRCIQNPEKFVDIFNERIRLKHKKDKTLEDDLAQKADKLVLNTTFGASGNKFLELYDPYMCTSVCRVGQIFLAALACKLHKTVNSIKIVQSNTDGILAYFARNEKHKVEQCMNEWTALSGINMELEEVARIWQRDVNNYLLIECDGKIKRKGNWLNDDYYRPGYVTVASPSAIVCNKAAIQYLLHGEDIINYIVNDKNVGDFAINCTKGPTYSGVVHRMSDGSETPLFKANRVIATKNVEYGRIYKIKKYKEKISYTQMPSTPEHCLTVNADYEYYDFDTMIKPELDYMYYVQRCIDLLNIQWYQLKGSKLIINNDYDIISKYQ